MCSSRFLVLTILLFFTAILESVISDDEFPFPKNCGIEAVTDRIIQGDLARLEDAPWMALLKFQTEAGGGYGCGGALINKRYVLTAAHCVVGKFGAPVEVTLGEYNVDSAEDCEEFGDIKICTDPPKLIQIEEVIKHPEYVKESPQKLHDIALIRLKATTTFTDFIQPVCVPTKEIRDNIYKNANRLKIVGWGRTKHRPASNLKRFAYVPRVANDVCSKNRTYKIADTQICAGGAKQDSCSGDSGGPMTGVHTAEDQGDVQHYVVGIISFGTKSCGVEGVPSVYTNVAEYYDWIKANMKP